MARCNQCGSHLRREAASTPQQAQDIASELMVEMPESEWMEYAEKWARSTTRQSMSYAECLEYLEQSPNWEEGFEYDPATGWEDTVRMLCQDALVADVQKVVSQEL